MLRHTLLTIWKFAVFEHRIRLQGYTLGLLWTLLNPVFFFSVTYLVFHHSLGQGIGNYSHFVALGLLLWMFFSRTSALAAAVLERKKHSLRDSQISPAIPLVASVLSMMFGTFLESVCLLTLLCIVFGGFSLISWISLFFSVVMVSFLVVGIGGIIAYVATYFRDVLHIWSLALQILIFATPVFYPIDNLKGLAAKVVWLNPLSPAFTICRSDTFLEFVELSTSYWLVWVLYISVAVVGVILCQLARVRIVEKS